MFIKTSMSALYKIKILTSLKKHPLKELFLLNQLSSFEDISLFLPHYDSAADKGGLIPSLEA